MPRTVTGTGAPRGERGAARAPLCAALALAILLGFGALMLARPSAGEAGRVLLYVLLFNLLPGVAAARLLLGPARGAADVALLALPAGIVANLLAAVLAWPTGASWLPWTLPPAGAALLAMTIRRGREGPRWPAWKDVPRWAGVALLLAVTSLVGMANVLAGDPGDAFSFHSAFQAIIVRGLERGWPAPNLLLPDTNWSYNHAAHLWVLGAARVTGVPVDALVARYGPVVLAGAAAAGLVAAGRIALGLPGWAAALALGPVFWVAGIPAVLGQVFGTFVPFSGVLLLSPFLALAVFLIAVIAVVEWPGGDSGEQSGGRYGLPLLLFALCFLGTGARAALPPVLICALGLRAAVALWTRRTVPWRETADVAAAILGFAAGLWLFFRPDAGLNGLGFVQFNGHPFRYLTEPSQYLLTLPHLLTGAGLPALAAGVIAFLVLALGQAGFLAPALPAGLARYEDGRGGDRRGGDGRGGDGRGAAVLLLAGAAFAGISALFLTEAPGYSQFSFVHFANASLALLGALGLSRLVADRGWRRPAGLAALVSVAALAVLHAGQFRGPALDWLAARAVPGLAAPVPPVATCLDPADAALMERVTEPRAVVILIPRTPDGTFLCRTFWAVARSGVQGMSHYALTFVPGRAEGPLGRLLAERGGIMTAALATAAGGALPGAEMLRLRATLDPARPAYALTDTSLVGVPDGAEVVARGVAFTLWRLPGGG
ncbi:hypothetical protein ACE7GA_08885 [Roseomonas sp. CCTCC AB2023176]|uniref:hypothetical protein n=1 Tax=Roseomonas sp. CCTCC AB2023176 TaxID=3342640 RepID=UPI0035DB2EE4